MGRSAYESTCFSTRQATFLSAVWKVWHNMHDSAPRVVSLVVTSTSGIAPDLGGCLGPFFRKHVLIITY